MLKHSFNHSIIKLVIDRYCLLEEGIEKICRNSEIYSTAELILHKIKDFLKTSFVCNAADLIGSEHSQVLDDSRVITRISHLCKRVNKKILTDLDGSGTIGLLREIGRGLYFNFLQGAGVIMVTAVIISSIQSILARQSMDVLGWSIRAGFFFAGIAGLFSEAGWNDVSKTSYFLRLLYGANSKR